MGKTEAEVPERKEKTVVCCKVSTWFKLVNMVLGGLMIVFSIFTFFSIDVPTDQLIMVYSFKVYQM